MLLRLILKRGIHDRSLVWLKASHAFSCRHSCATSLRRLRSARLRRQDPQQRAEEPEADGIVVTGRRHKSSTGSKTTAATKLPTEPLLSSQNVTVITGELIQDQGGARCTGHSTATFPGVSFFSYAGVTARGFRQEEIFFDGLRGDPYAGFSVPQLVNLERVEFLKGPSGMLYGPGAPGGLFNYVTKKPQNTAFSADVRGIVGNADRFGGSAEVNAPLGGDFAARGGLFYEDRGLFRFNASSRTFIADGGVSWSPGPVKLILQATLIDQELDANRLRGVPVDDDGNFLASRRWNHNEPDDFLNLRSEVLQGRIEAEPLAGVTFDATLRYNNAVEEQQYHEPRALFDSDGDGAIDASVREFRDQRREQDTWSFGTNLVWATDIGGLGNRMLVGGDYFDGSLDFDSRLVRGGPAPAPGVPTPLSLNNPVYGQSDSATYNLPGFQNRLTEGYRWGAYLLDELTIGRLILTGGLRFRPFQRHHHRRRLRFHAGRQLQRRGRDLARGRGLSHHRRDFRLRSVCDQFRAAGHRLAGSACRRPLRPRQRRHG